MTKQDLVERMQQGQAWIPGKRVKIDFGGSEGAVMLDGAAQQITEEDGAADTTIKVGWDDWQQMAAGQLDGMTAFMMGKLKVEGDMSNAMQLQSVFAKLRGWARGTSSLNSSTLPSGSRKKQVKRRPQSCGPSVISMPSALAKSSSA